MDASAIDAAGIEGPIGTRCHEGGNNGCFNEADAPRTGCRSEARKCTPTQHGRTKSRATVNKMPLVQACSGDSEAAMNRVKLANPTERRRSRPEGSCTM